MHPAHLAQGEPADFLVRIRKEGVEGVAIPAYRAHMARHRWADDRCVSRGPGADKIGEPGANQQGKDFAEFGGCEGDIFGFEGFGQRAQEGKPELGDICHPDLADLLREFVEELGGERLVWLLEEDRHEVSECPRWRGEGGGSRRCPGMSAPVGSKNFETP